MKIDESSWLILSALCLSFFMGSCSPTHEVKIKTASEFQQKTQEELINATPGSIIQLPEGKFELDRTLSLSVDQVTIRGKGMGKTILSFKNQVAGSEGLMISSNQVKLEDFAIEDTKGDALKLKGSQGVTIRRVRTEWTRGPNTDNGAYGIYPVECKDVLIEDSVSIGASDSGIYVGQSENIVVRRNRAEFNVAGIEIENSRFAEVYENQAKHNTGGILVFNLPDLPNQGGRYTRVYKNEIIENNTENFAAKGNIVGIVPKGTGILLVAAKDVEVFDNTVRNHTTTSIAVAAYGITSKPIHDARYNPFSSGIYIHHNRFTESGSAPSGFLIRTLSLVVGKPLPDVLYDGEVDPKILDAQGKLPEASRICLQDNGNIRFANIDSRHNFKNISRDLAPYNCALARLKASGISGVKL